MYLAGYPASRTQMSRKTKSWLSQKDLALLLCWSPPSASTQVTPPWTVGPSQCSKHTGAVRQHSWDGCLRACCKLMLQGPTPSVWKVWQPQGKPVGSLRKDFILVEWNTFWFFFFWQPLLLLRDEDSKKLPSVKMPCSLSDHKTHAGICCFKNGLAEMCKPVARGFQRCLKCQQWRGHCGLFLHGPGRSLAQGSVQC